MVQKEFVTFGIISVLALGFFIMQLQQTFTGNYAAGPGGNHFTPSRYVQFSPREACRYEGYVPTKPIEVVNDAYGTLAICNGPNGQVLVPLVQVIG